MKKNTLVIMLSAAFIAVMISSCATLSENWFLYPEQYTDLPIQNTGKITGEEVTMTAKDGTKLSGIILKNSISNDYLLYFYGNMESIKESSKRLYFLAAEYGINVICFDYRGYGKSAGKATFDNLPLDAIDIYDFVKAAYFNDKSRMYMFTQSLGTVPGTYVGARRAFSGIVMEAPFTNAEEAVSQMPEGLVWPFKDIIKLRADDKLLAKKDQPINNIRKFKAPLLIIHGENDNVFPVRAGEKMYNAAGSFHKLFCRLRDTAHADVNIYQGRALEEMRAFFKKHKKTLEPAKKK